MATIEEQLTHKHLLSLIHNPTIEEQTLISPRDVSGCIKLMNEGKLSHTNAKKVLRTLREERLKLLPRLVRERTEIEKQETALEKT